MGWQSCCSRFNVRVSDSVLSRARTSVAASRRAASSIPRCCLLSATTLGTSPKLTLASFERRQLQPECATAAQASLLQAGMACTACCFCSDQINNGNFILDLYKDFFSTNGVPISAAVHQLKHTMTKNSNDFCDLRFKSFAASALTVSCVWPEQSGRAQEGILLLP